MSPVNAPATASIIPAFALPSRTGGDRPGAPHDRTADQGGKVPGDQRHRHVRLHGNSLCQIHPNHHPSSRRPIRFVVHRPPCWHIAIPFEGRQPSQMSMMAAFGPASAAGALAVGHDQGVIGLLEHRTDAKGCKPAIDGRPGRKIRWQEPPDDPAAKHVKDGVDDLAHRPGARTPGLAGRWQARFDQATFGIRQIGLVTRSRPAMLFAGGRDPHENLQTGFELFGITGTSATQLLSKRPLSQDSPCTTRQNWASLSQPTCLFCGGSTNEADCSYCIGRLVICQ